MPVKLRFDGSPVLFCEVSDNRVWTLEHVFSSPYLIYLHPDVSSEVGLVKQLEKLEAILLHQIHRGLHDILLLNLELYHVINQISTLVTLVAHQLKAVNVEVLL